jgi:hypothetical protein
MVDGLHILTQNRTKKPLAIVLSGVGKGSRERDSKDDLINVLFRMVTMNPPCTTNIF